MKVNYVTKSFSFLLALCILTACERPEGCTDPEAANYDPFATENSGSCYYINDQGEECDCPSDEGTLKITNTSLNTIQRVVLDNKIMGNLAPGDEETWKVSPGDYILLIEDAYGNAGCEPMNVNIVSGLITEKTCDH